MEENILSLEGRLEGLLQEKEPNWEEVENILIKIDLRQPWHPLHEYKERGVIVVNMSKWPDKMGKYFLSKEEFIIEGLSPKTSWHPEIPNYERVIFEVTDPDEADILAVSHYSLDKEVVIAFLRPDGTPSFYIVSLYSGKIEKSKNFVEGKTTLVPIWPDELAKREEVLQKINSSIEQGQKPDFSRVNLDQVNLFDVELRKANLQGASLREANLTGADLECVKHIETTLTGI